MAIQPEGQAPYAPPATVIEVLERYRSRGLAEPFTIDVLMRAGVPDSLASRTLQALKLLDLVDAEGHSTEALKLLARTSSDEYQQAFAQVVRAAYADVFAFADPARDPIPRIEDAFRNYHPRGQRGRAVTLFLGLCAYAGIIDTVPVRPTTAKTKSMPTPPKPRSSSDPKPSKAQLNVDISAPSNFNAGQLDPALAGVLQRLPVPGSTWSEDERDRFTKALLAVLDIVYSVEQPDRGIRGELTSGPKN